ncbi:MAG TPA: MFS transporter [Motilibacteraceae bacterium]|nr:MFS transporter [Motilibacteraceae bacterium]
MSGTAGRKVRLVDVLRDREVAGLVCAQVLSDWGDQVGRVALAVLLLRAHDSALLAALVFAVAFVADVVGSALLGPLADRLPRRAVMVGCDLLRAFVLSLLALVALAETSAPALLVLLLVAELFTGPFEAARRALLGDVLPDPGRFYVVSGLVRTLWQADQVVGLLLGGAVVALTGPETALFLDAASFVLSALLALVLVRRRPAALQARTSGLRSYVAEMTEGVRLVRADVRRRSVLLVGWGSTVFLLAPEGAALAFAKAHGAGSQGGALLMAAVPFGAAIGAALVSRRSPEEQLALVLPLATAGAGLLLPMAVDPPVPLAAVLWALSGACQGYMVTLIATLMMVTPAAARGRVGGLASAGFAAASAGSFVLAGWVADRATPAFAVTLSGVLGLAVLAWVGRSWPEASLRRAVLAATAPGAGEPDSDEVPAAGATGLTVMEDDPGPGAVDSAPLTVTLPEPRPPVTSREPA